MFGEYVRRVDLSPTERRDVRPDDGRDVHSLSVIIRSVISRLFMEYFRP